MKIFKSRHCFFSLFAILLLTGFPGCNGNLTDANQADGIDLASGEFAVFDTNDIMDQIQDATIDSDMSFSRDFMNGNLFRRGGRFGMGGPRMSGPRRSRGRTGNHFGVLKDLALTDEQKTQAREAMAGHRDCIQAHLQAFRDANQAIIDAANEQRRAIRESVRAGELTREEARAQIGAINASTREAILNNPDSQGPIQALCDCKTALFDSIRAILDETQQVAWDEWVAGLSGLCFGG